MLARTPRITIQDLTGRSRTNTRRDYSAARALSSERGLEGIVAKDKQSPYVSGRGTGHWLKVKNPGFQRKEPVEFRVTCKR
jgi:ATP-dependent DNA ligase